MPTKPDNHRAARRLGAASAIAMMMLAGTAHAEPASTGTPTPKLPDNGPATPSASSPAPLTGFGTDVPLADAMKLIVPQGWKTTIAGAGTSSLPISWSASGSWENTIRSIAARHDLNATIDNGARTLLIAPNGASVATAAPAPANRAVAMRATDHPHHRAVRNRHRHRSEGTAIASGETWRGGTRFDSPTIYDVPPGEARDMEIPTHGQPLSPYAVPGASVAMASADLARQHAAPAFGDTYVPSRPVAPIPSYTLGYDARSPESRVWNASSGETVDDIIRRWAAESGERWQVYSDRSHQPMTIMTNIAITGSFTDAVRQLTESYQGMVTPVVHASASSMGNVITITDSDHASPSLQ